MTTATIQHTAAGDLPLNSGNARTSRSDDNIEALRQILTSEQRHEVTYDEACEIGNSLLEFYQALAEEECDEPAA